METRKQFLLRINPELWTELERWAAEELRSVNGQIEYILRQAIIRRKSSGDKKTTHDNSQTS
ncbi:MAG: Arc family DNA binding domain-containing protein [Planctomycetota bacterium]|nr:Arc family DNA binding domain-containing protein [Planctomycetota bacterium]